MAKRTAPAATPATTLMVTPTPTVRHMIVVVPDQLPTQVLRSTRQLDTHLGVQATSWARFWAKPGLRPWQRQNMIDLRKGQPAYCAGGPARLLDLAAMRHGAAVGAGIRHQHWSRAVHGTKAATPWHVYMRRHLDDRSQYPLEVAKADFTNQPRVNAMRIHNAACYGAAQLDVAELEMYQAGQMAYQNYHALWALCLDALLTHDGALLQPDSDAFAHQVTYLDAALRYLDGLDDAVRLLAVTL